MSSFFNGTRVERYIHTLILITQNELIGMEVVCSYSSLELDEAMLNGLINHILVGEFKKIDG